MSYSTFSLILAIMTSASSSLFAIDAQDSNEVNNASKHGFSVEVGAQKSVIGKQVFVEGPKLPCECEYRMWGYNAGSTVGMQLNLLYDYRFTKDISVRSGISFYGRPEIYSSDSNTLSQVKSEYNLIILDQTEVERRISAIGFEIPIYLGLELGKIQWYVGMHTVIAQFITRRSAYTNRSSTSASFLSWNHPSTSVNFYLDSRVYYKLSTPNLDFAIFMGINLYNANFWKYEREYNYAQFGIHVPLTKEASL